MKFQLTAFILTAILAPLVLCGKKTEATWRKLLKDHADCVTWVSATVRVEVSAGGRSMPPQEQKLEALGTIIAEDGLTVLSLSRVDPTATLLAHTHPEVRTPIHGVLHSCRMGRRPASCCSRTPTWTWLTLCQSRKRVKKTKSDLSTRPVIQNQRPSAFGRGRIFGQAEQKPLQTIDFEKRMGQCGDRKTPKIFRNRKHRPRYSGIR